MTKTYDPHMHTAEHVLNQTMVRTFGCGRCFSSHLNPKKSKCDYFFDRDLTETEAQALAAAVNAILAQHLPVTSQMTPVAEAATLVDLSKLPDTAAAAGEPVRLVRIGEYDICPCIFPVGLTMVCHQTSVGVFPRAAFSGPAILGAM